MRLNLIGLPENSTVEWPHQYVHAQPETVYYVQETGDYENTPKNALGKLVEHFKDKAEIRSIYGMGLSNPSKTEVNACRFEAFAKVKLNEKQEIENEIMKRTLPGGSYAVFTYEGDYSGLSDLFAYIYEKWLPNSGYQKTDHSAFCEYTSYFDTSAEKPIIKVHLPLKG